jgi:hypothetical protein
MVEMRVLILYQVERVRVIKEIPVPLDQVKAMVVTAEENEALETRRVANKGNKLQLQATENSRA